MQQSTASMALVLMHPLWHDCNPGGLCDLAELEANAGVEAAGDLEAG